MKKLFNSNREELDLSLEKFGFCTTDLFEAETVESLKNLYLSQTKGQFEGFHPTMFHSDEKYRETINNGIVSIVKPILDSLINEAYEVFYANFMVKEPGKSSEMKIHQDWSYVDESKERSFAIWFPLVDLTIDNGAFAVIPYSHNSLNIKRGPGTYCPFYQHFDLIRRKFSKQLYLKKGQAVFWDHRLAHYSPSNLSQEARIAVTLILVPKETDKIHFFKPSEGDQIYKYKVNGKFFERYRIGISPDLPIWENEIYQAVKYDEIQLVELLTPFKVKGIFKDNMLNETFSKEGYVVLDLMNKGEFENFRILFFELFDKYQSAQSSINADYDLSFFRQNATVKRQIFNAMWNFFSPYMAKYLPDYEPLIINMFNKPPGKGEVPIHQNWSFVDEDYHTTVSVWIPLCDVGRWNGTLEVIPGTHLNISRYRSPTIPWAFEGMEILLKEKYMKPLELQEGQVSILDDAIIHFSGENHSEEFRPTVQLILKPKNSQAIHYFRSSDQAGLIKAYGVDADFFMNFDMHSTEINAPLLETIQVELPKVDESDVLESLWLSKGS